MEDSVVVWDTGMDGAESDRFCVNERERERESWGHVRLCTCCMAGPKGLVGKVRWSVVQVGPRDLVM